MVKVVKVMVLFNYLKYFFQLSRSWLGEKAVDKLVPMYNCSLLVTLQFIPSEVTLRRVPTARTAGLFGAKIQQVCK